MLNIRFFAAKRICDRHREQGDRIAASHSPAVGKPCCAGPHLSFLWHVRVKALTVAKERKERELV
jgi:hypothetical protein